MRLTRIARVLVPAVVVFVGLTVAAVVLVLLTAPTASPAGLVAFLASMFAVTGAVVTAAVIGTRER